MPEAVPTVAIVNPDKPEEQLVMNAIDYDPTKHLLWDERDSKPLPKPAPPASASPAGGMRAPGAPFVKEEADAPKSGQKPSKE